MTNQLTVLTLIFLVASCGGPSKSPSQIAEQPSPQATNFSEGRPISQHSKIGSVTIAACYISEIDALGYATSGAKDKATFECDKEGKEATVWNVLSVDRALGEFCNGFIVRFVYDCHESS